jgi:hypothetical protein
MMSLTEVSSFTSLGYDSLGSSSFTLSKSLPVDLSEITFFKQASNLIQSLKVGFFREPVHQAVYRFLQLSVHFWKKIIPPPENEKTLYTINQLSDSSDYFAQVVSLIMIVMLLSILFMMGLFIFHWIQSQHS